MTQYLEECVSSLRVLLVLSSGDTFTKSVDKEDFNQPNVSWRNSCANVVPNSQASEDKDDQVSRKPPGYPKERMETVAKRGTTNAQNLPPLGLMLNIALE